MPLETRPPTPNPIRGRPSDKARNSHDAKPPYQHAVPRWVVHDWDCVQDDTADAALRWWDISKNHESNSELYMGGEMVLPMRRSSIANNEPATKPQRRKVEFSINQDAKNKPNAHDRPPRTKNTPFACMPFDPKVMNSRPIVQVKPAPSSRVISPKSSKKGLISETDPKQYIRRSSRNWEDDLTDKYPFLKRNVSFKNGSPILPPPQQFSNQSNNTAHYNYRSCHDKIGMSSHTSKMNAPCSSWDMYTSCPKYRTSSKDRNKSPMRAVSSEVPVSNYRFGGNEVPRRVTKDNHMKREDMFPAASRRNPLSPELRQVIRRCLQQEKSKDKNRTTRVISDLRFGRTTPGFNIGKRKKDTSMFHRPASDIGLRANRPTIITPLVPNRSLHTRKWDCGRTDSSLAEALRRQKASMPTVAWTTKPRRSQSDIALQLRRHTPRDSSPAKNTHCKSNMPSEVGNHLRRHNTADGIRKAYMPKCGDSKQNSISESGLRRPFAPQDKMAIMQEWLNRKRSVPTIRKSASDFDVFPHKNRHTGGSKASGQTRVWHFPKTNVTPNSQLSQSKIHSRDSGTFMRSNSPRAPCSSSLTGQTWIHPKSNHLSESNIIPNKVNVRSNSLSRDWTYQKASLTLSEPRVTFGKSSRSTSPITKFSRSTSPITKFSRSTSPITKFSRNTPPITKFSRNTPPITKFSRNTPPITKFSRSTPPITKFSRSTSPIRFPSPYQKTNNTLSEPHLNSYKSHVSLKTTSPIRNWGTSTPGSTIPEPRLVPSSVRSNSRSTPLTPQADSSLHEVCLNQVPQLHSLGSTASIAPYEQRNWVHTTKCTPTNEPRASAGRSNLHDGFYPPIQHPHLGRKTNTFPKNVTATGELTREKRKTTRNRKSRHQSPNSRLRQNECSKRDYGKPLCKKSKKNNLNKKNSSSETELLVRRMQSTRIDKSECVKLNSPKHIPAAQDYSMFRNRPLLETLCKTSKSNKCKESSFLNPNKFENTRPHQLFRIDEDVEKRKEKGKSHNKVDLKRTDTVTKGKLHQRRSLKVQVPLPTELLNVSNDSVVSDDSVKRKFENSINNFEFVSQDKVSSGIDSENTAAEILRKRVPKKITIADSSNDVDNLSHRGATSSSSVQVHHPSGMGNTSSTLEPHSAPEATILYVSDTENELLRNNQNDAPKNTQNLDKQFPRSPQLTQSDYVKPTSNEVPSSDTVDSSTPDRPWPYFQVTMNEKLPPKPRSASKETVKSDIGGSNNLLIKSDRSSRKRTTRNRVSKEIFDALPLHNQYAINDFSALLGIARLLDLDPNSCVVGVDVPIRKSPTPSKRNDRAN